MRLYGYERVQFILSKDGCWSQQGMFILNSLSCKGAHLRLSSPFFPPFQQSHCVNRTGHGLVNLAIKYSSRNVHTVIFQTNRVGELDDRYTNGRWLR